MTFSIAAHCPETGLFGAAITSSMMCVGSRCPFARAGVGVALSQHRSDPLLGSALLDAMESGASATEAMQAVAASTSHAGWRQLACVDRFGETAVFHGDRIHSIHAEARDDHVIAIGNILDNPGVPAAMLEAYLRSKEEFPGRLVAALEGGLKAGGEEFELRSAALIVEAKREFPHASLRIDDDREPISGLRRLWETYRPLADVIERYATDPDGIPP